MKRNRVISLGVIVIIVAISIIFFTKNYFDGNGKKQIEHVENNESITQNEILQEEEFLLLKTPLGDIYYPHIWNDIINIQEFVDAEYYYAEVYCDTSCGNLLLYTLYIGGEWIDAVKLGSVNDTSVFIKMEDVNVEECSEAEKIKCYSMQEDINYIIDQIMKMPGFVENNQVEGINSVEGDSYEDNFVLLNTPIGEIKYPACWKDYVEVESSSISEGYVAEIRGLMNNSKAKLFTLYIGVEVEEGNSVGWVDGYNIRFQLEDLDIDIYTADEKKIFYAMQDEINYILEQIYTIPGFEYGKDSLMDFQYDFNSEEKFLLATTNIGEIYYPNKWNEKVYVEEISVSKGYAIEVYGKSENNIVKLYTIYFGSEQEKDFSIGFVNGVEICFKMEELIGGYENHIEVYEMQEDVNYIIEQIKNMPGYSELDTYSGHKVDKDTVDEDSNEFVLLSTPLGDLNYPKKWEESVFSCTLPVEQGYGAAVYGRTNSGSMKLFTIYIGIEKKIGQYVGSVNGSAVYIVPIKPIMHNWSSEEKDTIYSMQEDVNFLLDQICNMPGYMNE